MKKILVPLLLALILASCTPSNPNATIRNDTSIYANNTGHGRVTANIEEDARIRVGQRTADGQWYYITHQDRSGWVKGEDVALDAGAQVEVLPTQTTRPTQRPTARPAATLRPTATTRPTARANAPNCDPSYPTVCIPRRPPDLNCGDISYRRFKVLPPDPHGFDSDNDGVGCES